MSDVFYAPFPQEMLDEMHLQLSMCCQAIQQFDIRNYSVCDSVKFAVDPALPESRQFIRDTHIDGYNAKCMPVQQSPSFNHNCYSHLSEAVPKISRGSLPFYGRTMQQSTGPNAIQFQQGLTNFQRGLRGPSPLTHVGHEVPGRGPIHLSADQIPGSHVKHLHCDHAPIQWGPSHVLRHPSPDHLVPTQMRGHPAHVQYGSTQVPSDSGSTQCHWDAMQLPKGSTQMPSGPSSVHCDPTQQYIGHTPIHWTHSQLQRAHVDDYQDPTHLFSGPTQFQGLSHVPVGPTQAQSGPNPLDCGANHTHRDIPVQKCSPHLPGGSKPQECPPQQQGDLSLCILSVDHILRDIASGTRSIEHHGLSSVDALPLKQRVNLPNSGVAFPKVSSNTTLVQVNEIDVGGEEVKEIVGIEIDRLCTPILASGQTDDKSSYVDGGAQVLQPISIDEPTAVVNQGSVVCSSGDAGVCALEQSVPDGLLSDGNAHSCAGVLGDWSGDRCGSSSAEQVLMSVEPSGGVFPDPKQLDAARQMTISHPQDLQAYYLPDGGQSVSSFPACGDHKQSGMTSSLCDPGLNPNPDLINEYYFLQQNHNDQHRGILVNLVHDCLGGMNVLDPGFNSSMCEMHACQVPYGDQCLACGLILWMGPLAVHVRLPKLKSYALQDPSEHSANKFRSLVPEGMPFIGISVPEFKSAVYGVQAYHVPYGDQGLPCVPTQWIGPLPSHLWLPKLKPYSPLDTKNCIPVTRLVHERLASRNVSGLLSDEFMPHPCGMLAHQLPHGGQCVCCTSRYGYAFVARGRGSLLSLGPHHSLLPFGLLMFTEIAHVSPVLESTGDSNEV